MILVDTSAWVEFLRGTGSAIHVRLRSLHELTAELFVTDVVTMELLAGVRTLAEQDRVEAVVFGLPSLNVEPDDFIRAADFFRTCRRGGETVRKLDDCLIAAVAIRNDVPVLHADRDFDVLARHTRLQVA